MPISSYGETPLTNSSALAPSPPAARIVQANTAGSGSVPPTSGQLWPRITQK